MNQCAQIYCEELPNEIKEQVRIIECSKYYTALIVIGLFITLYHTNLQENQLICSTICGETCECPQLLPLRFISSIIILIALVFFYDLSCQTAQSSCGNNCSANTSFTASTLTLTAALIRLIDFICTSKT